MRWVEGEGGFVFSVPLEFVQGTVVDFEGEITRFKVTDYSTRWLVGGGLLSRGKFQGQWLRKGKILNGYSIRESPCR